MADSPRPPPYCILQSQGFGTRRYCKDPVLVGLVFVNGAEMESPDALVDTAGLVLDVNNERWVYHARAYLMFNKPAGVECSQKPKHHLSVHTLLSVPPRKRAVQYVGRLDQGITGLLLLADNGQSVYTITSPRYQVPEVYEITTAEPVTEAQIAQLCVGVLLADENENVAAAWVKRIGTHHLRVALTQGKHHQVKRTVAVAGNHVAGLHRSAIGRLSPRGLVPGERRWSETADLKVLNTTPPHATGPSI